MELTAQGNYKIKLCYRLTVVKIVSQSMIHEGTGLNQPLSYIFLGSVIVGS